ncbi:efflux transporter outer membrane subunit [Sediminitomix flava]|uniref:Multidrug efflux system outer membrane protein n=1 Tax=Sediminitomix flava TaxID=379075 RepID=A0A315ZB96_SEDFL|nr:efflux transporter outer membrane subunit [Sediminitomix flava]PWJ42856.1 multidrug efflux system outer membrane protein [Sediminitomix flava]
MKNTIKYIYFIGFLLVLASCKVGPNYQKPESELPTHLRFGTLETSTLADTPWWELYQDTVLQELIQTAIDSNRNMRIAAQRIIEAEGVRRVAGSPMFPQLGVASEVNANGDKSSSSATESEFFGVYSWELDLWGKIRRGKEAALAEYLGTVEAYKSITLSLVSSVAGGYFELLDLDYRLSITRSTVIARQEAYRIAKLRFENGITSELELRQAEVELFKTEATLPDLERQMAQKENEICVLLGQTPQEVKRGMNLISQPLPPEIPSGLPSELLQRRPDVLQAEQGIVAANAKVGITKANFYPTIRLTGENGLVGNDLSSFLSVPSWENLIAISAPIFTGGANKGRMKAAKANYEKSVNAYQHTVLTAFQEVSDALVQNQKNKVSKEAQIRYAGSTEQYLRLANLQYINGLISYIDVLDAQRRSFEAELSVSVAVKNELLSVVNLYKSLGGGWERPTDESTN